MPDGDPTYRPTASLSVHQRLSLNDVDTMRRLAGGPIVWGRFRGWRGHGPALQYLEQRGMVRMGYDWQRLAPMAELSNAGILWLAKYTTWERGCRAGG